MEALVRALKVDSGCSVLEIGFGLGFSASAMQPYHPKSHDIVECSETVLTSLVKWAEDKPAVRVIPGRWQDVMPTLGVYDRVFFDDYPLEEHDVAAVASHGPGWSRWHEFLDALFAGGHVRVGSVITGYLARSDVDFTREGCSVKLTEYAVEPSAVCNYFSSDTAFIPLITVESESALTADASYAKKFSNRVMKDSVTERLIAAALKRRDAVLESASNLELEEHHGPLYAELTESLEQRRERLKVMRQAAGLSPSI